MTNARRPRPARDSSLSTLASVETAKMLGGVQSVTSRKAAAEHSKTKIPRPPLASDELWMEEALRSAQRAMEAGEVPVGAVVVCDRRIVASGSNRSIAGSDPTAHAEIIALREAGANMGNYRLEDCELFSTIEPCAMCAGAMVHARIKRLVYGADDPKAGAVHSVMQVLNHSRLNHKIEVQSGVLAGRSAEMLQVFFRNRR